MNDLARLVSDLDRAAKLAPRRAGAALGAGADRIRDEASRNLSRNLSPRFGDAVHARRESSGSPAAYVLVDEEMSAAVYAWEVGTARHGPRPSIAPAVESQEAGIVEAVADIAKGLL